MSLYMFRALNAHLQEDTLDTCSIWYCHSLREFVVVCRCTLCTICCMYPVYPPEDEHLMLETCRGT
jgi:hypothetical protein